MKYKSFESLTNTSSKLQQQLLRATFRWYLFKQQQPLRVAFCWYLKHLKFILIVGFLALFTGCSIKPEPVYKEVLTPIRCQAKMPVKPVNDGSFEAHKNKMIYYLRCESTLKYCLGLSELKGDKGD